MASESRAIQLVLQNQVGLRYLKLLMDLRIPARKPVFHLQLYIRTIQYDLFVRQSDRQRGKARERK